MTSTVVRLDVAKAKANTEPFAFSKTSIRARLDKIPEGAINIILRDTEQRGLILRKQRRDWQFAVERKVGGKKRRVTLGEWNGQNDIATLRTEVRRILAEIEGGTYEKPSPIPTTNALADMTVAGAMKLHAEVNPQLRATSITAYMYSVCDLTCAETKQMAEGIDTAPIRMADVTTQLVRQRYDILCDEKSPATANRMLRTIRALWATWATEHPEGEEPLRNPVTSLTRKRGRVVKVKPRQGALTTAERLPWIRNMQGRDNDAAAALAFVFYTGLRRDEALGLSWDEVDRDAGTITITADRMKAGEELTRPITPAMRAILDSQRAKHPTGHYVFPARRGPKHLTETRKTLWAVGEAVLGDKERIIIHDLRRTYAAAAALSGLPDVAVKLLLGHTTSDVTDAYKSALRSELPVLALKVEAELLREVEQ